MSRDQEHSDAAGPDMDDRFIMVDVGASARLAIAVVRGQLCQNTLRTLLDYVGASLGDRPAVDDAKPVHDECVSFGPFRLFLLERRLERSGAPVSLGARAFDILKLLIERHGEVVRKQDIFERVWPNISVDEVSLRVQIAAIRRALKDKRDSNRYLVTVPGRGYCFVAPVSRSSAGKGAGMENVVPLSPQRLKARPTPLAARKVTRHNG